MQDTPMTEISIEKARETLRFSEDLPYTLILRDHSFKFYPYEEIAGHRDDRGIIVFLGHHPPYRDATLKDQRECDASSPRVPDTFFCLIKTQDDLAYFQNLTLWLDSQEIRS